MSQVPIIVDEVSGPDGAMVWTIRYELAGDTWLLQRFFDTQIEAARHVEERLLNSGQFEILIPDTVQELLE